VPTVPPVTCAPPVAELPPLPVPPVAGRVVVPPLPVVPPEAVTTVVVPPLLAPPLPALVVPPLPPAPVVALPHAPSAMPSNPATQALVDTRPCLIDVLLLFIMMLGSGTAPTDRSKESDVAMGEARDEISRDNFGCGGQSLESRDPRKSA
jgi:hypothetical protein